MGEGTVRRLQHSVVRISGGCGMAGRTRRRRKGAGDGDELHSEYERQLVKHLWGTRKRIGVPEDDRELEEG